MQLYEYLHFLPRSLYSSEIISCVPMGDMRAETPTPSSSSTFCDSPTARKRGASRLQRKFGEALRLRDAWYKKSLRGRDVSQGRSALAVRRSWVVEQVLPFLEESAAARVECGGSERVIVHDCELDSLHVLYLRKLKTGDFVFAGRWRDEFVIRRNLKKGDKIGLCWQVEKSMFSFTALQLN